VRKAVESLAHEHILVRRQGKGTFVASHFESRAQFRFLKLRADVGPLQQPESEVLDCRKVRASAEISRVLNLRASEPALLIKRVLRLSDQPSVFEEIWLASSRFKGLSVERLADYRGPMYGLFEQEFATRMLRCEELVKAVGAHAEAAQALGVPLGAPLLQVERVSFTYEDESVEFRRGFYRTENHHYFNELS
jgi:GntR family transcriptional regulator